MQKLLRDLKMPNVHGVAEEEKGVASCHECNTRFTAEDLGNVFTLEGELKKEINIICKSCGAKNNFTVGGTL